MSFAIYIYLKFKANVVGGPSKIFIRVLKGEKTHVALRKTEVNNSIRRYDANARQEILSLYIMRKSTEGFYSEIPMESMARFLDAGDGDSYK